MVLLIGFNFQVTWYKDGSEIRSGRSGFEIVYSLGICSLETSCASLSDGGRYSCRAENDKGSDETNCKVTVAGMSWILKV